VHYCAGAERGTPRRRRVDSRVRLSQSGGERQIPAEECPDLRRVFHNANARRDKVSTDSNPKRGDPSSGGRNSVTRAWVGRTAARPHPASSSSLPNSEYFIIRVTCSCMCFETWLASSGEPASAARSGRILNDRAANFESIDVGLRTQGQTSCSWRFLQREPELKVVGAFRGEGGQFSICSERLVRVSDKRALTRNARPVIFGSFLDYST